MLASELSFLDSKRDLSTSILVILVEVSVKKGTLSSLAAQQLSSTRKPPGRCKRKSGTQPLEGFGHQVSYSTTPRAVGQCGLPNYKLVIAIEP